MIETVYCLGCGTGYDVTVHPWLVEPDLYPLANGMCRQCVREARRPVGHVLAENEKLRERLAEITRVFNEGYLPPVPGDRETLRLRALNQLRHLIPEDDDA